MRECVCVCPISCIRLRFFAPPQGPPATYHLVGVVVHSGFSANSGHYYAYVKTRGSWYLMNDSSVCGGGDTGEPSLTACGCVYVCACRFGRCHPPRC